MGLTNTILAGTSLTRTSTTLTINAGTSERSGSTESLGGSYILLSATAQHPCRIRLYTDQTSQLLDVARPVNNYTLNDAVGLIAEIVIDSSSLGIKLDPPVFGTTYSAGLTWYHISGSVLTGNDITLSAYPLSKQNDSTTDRSTLSVVGASIPSGSQVSGSITSPKSFLITSASANTISRLRLYSTPISAVPSTERDRVFGSPASSDANLIIDMMFDSASFSYKLVPIMEGYTWRDNVYLTGTNELGYILTNRTASPANISASIYIQSIED